MPKKNNRPEKNSEPDPSVELHNILSAEDLGGDIADALDGSLGKISLDNPLDKIDYDNQTTVKNREEEMSETLKAFRAAREGEKKLFQDATDSEYWLCLCFQNRDQKEAFLAALDLVGLGDKYLDGRKVARKLNVALPESNQRFITEKTEKRLTTELPSIRTPKKPIA